MHDLLEVLVDPVAPRETDERESRRQQPRFARSYTAGMSFLRERSPVTPKMTRLDGPAMRLRRRSEAMRSGLLFRVISTGMGQPIRVRRVATPSLGCGSVSVSTGRP
ncbi:hypothetical protein GCM10025869_31120 [Homoserinibacter gongjuensis]|uniref:Uncharacterized protein n=1 Tax=Homoserinibacter gongjuensis TaxID=1162968 RepID=A0ABQ6JYX7_9MICO|nr:hypothetical protein GCM10025869_31120 [Homoserinibacter gongjuensis]